MGLLDSIRFIRSAASRMVCGASCSVALLAAAPLQDAKPTTPDERLGAQEVAKILNQKCAPCHSGDGAQAGFQVHTREDLLKGGKSGPAIVPGRGAESLLVQKIAGKKGMRMPPSGPALEPDVIDRISRWIDAGAKFDAKAVVTERIAPFQPRTPAIPEGEAKAQPIDRFIAAYWQKKSVTPAPMVSDAVFARRAWLDVTGLLPTPEQLSAFEQDTTADKRAKLVDRLLTDRKAYAEHWISYWNDLLRNDEGVIYHGERKSITDWLLTSLEQNRPYDEMVRNLLDPTPKTGPEGFLTGVSWRGVVSASQTAPMQASQNAAQVFLGMNLKCAACHDSFVNRWKLRDTYGLAGMFSDEELELVRCDVKLGTKAEPKFPFPELKVSFDSTAASRRHAAAEWFTHPENGRIARTIVNRYWKLLVGRGIVEPADDMDAEPWDQDLLDWMASDFVARKYDLQYLIREIMNSRAYQTVAVVQREKDKDYVFRGPRLRRLTAEEFEDAISLVTGDWRVNNAKNAATASYTREWRLKSDPLSRALGRPIRDQVYTERNEDATTLQALELTNGPLLSKRLERGAHSLLGELKPAPVNLFDSKTVRGGETPIDIDITGAKELWLVVEDVDSYDPGKVIAGWADAQLMGPSGAVPLTSLTATKVTTQNIQLKAGSVPAIQASLPSRLKWDLAGKGFTRFQARAVIDESLRGRSDISPALRFFVFTAEPDPDQMIRVAGQPPSRAEQRQWSTPEITARLYTHLLARKPTDSEQRIAAGVLGGSKPTAAGVEDLLWMLVVSPEFQYIH